MPQPCCALGFCEKGRTGTGQLARVAARIPCALCVWIGNRKEKKVILPQLCILVVADWKSRKCEKEASAWKDTWEEFDQHRQLTIPEHCVKPADDHWYYSNGLNEIRQSWNNMCEDCADNAQLREQNWDGELTADTRGLCRLLLEMFSFRERVATRFVCCRSIHCGQRKQHCFKQFQTVKLRRIVRKSHVALICSR